MVELLDKSPLSHADAPLSAKVLNQDGLHLAELPRQGLLRLQGKPDALARGIEAVIGLPLPAANSFNSTADTSLVWIGPRRWLVRAPLNQVQDMAERLSRALGDIPHMLADASYQTLSIKLSGARANDLLRRTCSIDVDAADFAPGRAIRSLFGRLPVLLEYAKDGPEYRLSMDQSLARSAWDWFTAIAQDVAQS